jgi:hypothetical protein
MTAEDSPSQSSILSQATSSLSSSADHFSHHLGFSSPNMTGFLEEDHHYFGSPSVSCEAPLDITDYNFSDYDFPRAQGTFKPFTHVEYIKIIVTIVVILVALAGNLGIIIAVSFNRTLRTTINLYLVNLAVADILICTCCMSVYLINQLTEPLFILGPVVCKLNAFCQSKKLFYNSCEHSVALLFQVSSFSEAVFCYLLLCRRLRSLEWEQCYAPQQSDNEFDTTKSIAGEYSFEFPINSLTRLPKERAKSTREKNNKTLERLIGFFRLSSCFSHDSLVLFFQSYVR